MSTDLDASFNEQFTNINLKLKRKFMRKPNLAECTKEFVALGVRCEYSDQPTFAGHSYVGAAKCAATAGNPQEEYDHYLMAAKQFMKAEQKLRSMKFYSPDRENLEAAIGCYISAFNKHAEGTVLRRVVYMRLASELVSLGHLEEALHYQTLSIEHITDDITTKLNSYNEKLKLEIDIGKYDQAWRTVNELDQCLNKKATEDAGFKYSECFYEELQINRILLTLLTKPPTDSQPESLKQLMEDLMNGNMSKRSGITNPDLILKLQSIVMCTASGDVQTLVAVASEAGRWLTERQESVLRAIIRRERAEHLALT